jgi:formylglycine-generating enzyme required for sulfatase activity
MQAAKVIVFSLVAGAFLIPVGCGNVRRPDELPRAAAPFDAAGAGKLQERTARYLGMPVERKVDLGQNVQMTFVLIPAGEFEMGTPESEKDRESNEGPVHKVKISRPFYMSKFEVTQAQYEAVTGEKPSYFVGANLPVDEVTWDDAAFFCAKLTDKSGENLRLPTEAEWEYACRAGTTTRFYYDAWKSVGVVSRLV